MLCFQFTILFFLYRHPSGNNNGDSNDTTNITSEMNNSVIKSQSLPNLYRRKLMSSSIASVALSNSTVRIAILMKCMILCMLYNL